jgi:hypothetical protein
MALTPSSSSLVRVSFPRSWKLSLHIHFVGTSSIIHETTHQPLLSVLSSIVETVVRLRSQGHKVVLVSSGAIGVGMKRMELPARPKGLAAVQVGLLEWFRTFLISL